MTYDQLVARWRDMVETDYSFIMLADRMGFGHDAINLVKEGR